MSSIADDLAAELRELRRRAYAPGADIHDDPVAMARLHELESVVRVTAPEPTEPPPAPEPAAASVPLPDTAVEQTAVPHDGTMDAATAPPDEAASAGIPAPPTVAEASSSDTVARVPWWRRHVRLLWVASLVVATLLGAGLALSVQAVAAGQVAVLGVDLDGDWPESFWDPAPDDAQLFESFYGLTVLTVPQDFGDGMTPTTNCLYIMDGANSFGSGGCSAGGFPAIASLMVTRSSPEELRDRFGIGASLQFVHEGDRVRVYAAKPVPGETP